MSLVQLLLASAAAPASGIVTSGLVMHLDAGNAASYPGSGTVWTDLSGNSNNGTLTNGPTYSAADGGQIVFDGVNDFVSCGNAATLQLAVYTLEIWFKANNTNSGYRGLITKQGAYGLFLLNNVIGRYDWPSTNFASTGVNAGDNIWRQLVLTTSSAGGSNQTVYINGVSVLTASGSVDNQANELCVGSAIGLQYLAGSVAIGRVYNVALSAAKVSQNFNANRGRFGI